jgi:hypothetical protein
VKKQTAMTHVTLTGDEQLAGEYIVRDTREDGTVVLSPSSASDLDLATIGARPATTEEIEQLAQDLGVLPPDGEG